VISVINDHIMVMDSMKPGANGFRNWVALEPLYQVQLVSIYRTPTAQVCLKLSLSSWM